MSNEKEEDEEEYVEQPKTELKDNTTPTYKNFYAPYVRIASEKSGKAGDKVVKYDIRLCQSNFEHMDYEESHTLQHLASAILYASFDNIIDFSPNGSMTGFNLTMFNGVSEETMAKVMVEVMQKIAIWDKAIPGANVDYCGNYQSHDLTKAKKRAMMFIGGIMSKGYSAS